MGEEADTGRAGVDEATGGETTLVEAIAAGIAHEVRNPLNALQINLGILEQELSEIVPDRGSHVFEVIGKIAGELRSLDNFVTEFLRFARPPRPALELVAVRLLLAGDPPPPKPRWRGNGGHALAAGRTRGALMRTILLVEDHAESRSSLAWVLEKNGYAVRQASNGRAALAAARREKLHALPPTRLRPGVARLVSRHEHDLRIPKAPVEALRDPFPSLRREAASTLNEIRNAMIGSGEDGRGGH